MDGATPTKTTRLFHLGDILSITTGKLVSPRHIEGVYDILNFMTDDDLYTHALIRAGDECIAPLLAQHPDLADIVVPEFEDSEAVFRWLDQQVLKYGEQREVAPLAKGQHPKIDPISELLAMKPDAKVALIRVS